MKEWAIINGETTGGDVPRIRLDNRAFHFGDGLFESIRVVDGRPCFLDAHWLRLEQGLKLLRIEQPQGLDRSSLQTMLHKLVELSGHRSARCRLTVFRDADGHYRPNGHKGAFTLEIKPLPDPSFALNEHGWTVDIFPELRKPVNAMAVHKTLNCQLYVMASLWSESRGLDECLLQNDRGNIIESSSGNLFIVSNGVLYTPSLSDGCLGGVMRMQVINLALEHGIKVYECSLNPQNLLAADELFFTNAIRGLQWCASYRTKRYTHRMSEQLTSLLVSKVAG